MNQHTFQYSENQDIDFKRILKLIINHWLLIILSIIIALIVAYIYVRYSQPVYKAAGTIIVKDEASNSLGDDAVQLQGLDLFKNKKNLSTEIEIIKSKLMVERAVKNMPMSLRISYFAKGRFKTTDLYTSTPFIIEIDTLYSQAYNKTFDVEFVTEDKFKFIYEIGDGEKSGSIYQINELFNNDFGRFRLRLNPRGQAVIDHEDGYAFTIYHPASLVAEYRGKVDVTRADEETSILVISCDDQVAMRARDFVNTLIDQYTERSKDEKTKVANNTISFINEQLQQISDSLNLSEGNIEAFKREKGMTNLSADFALQRFTEFDKRRIEIELTLKSLDSLNSHIRRGGDISNISTSNIGAQDAAISANLNALNQLEIQRRNLLLNNTELAPQVRAINRQIIVIRDELLSNAQNFREALLTNLRIINTTLNRFEQKLAQIPTTERQFLGIERNRSLNENIFLLLWQQKMRTSIAKAATIADNVVLDYAGTPGTPIKPKTGMAYIIAVFASLSLCLSYIFIKDFLDDTITDRSQLEKMTLVPVLGTINHARNTYGSNLVVTDKPKSAIAEAFRSIRTNLQYLAIDADYKIVTVTSTISGEGKTFFSLNMAAILAISGKRILLMGLDLRKPKIHQDMGISNEQGMSTVLIGKAKAAQVIIKSKLENLDILPAGPIPPNPSELIMSDTMKNLLEELRPQYDYIIVDTPPIGLVTDALIAMKYADINIFIVRQKYSKKVFLDTVNKLQTDKSIRNLAIVLNDLRINKSYGYYNGYGNKYGYGYGYYEEESRSNGVIKKLSTLFSRSKAAKTK
ncbi:polysaccharide biosynthesis tyrosine autokinase [Rhodocytophaga rosea]|uniref:non-specific protein-tyrosine kinase n=1 Tax=Rhodocytophaga rosea TaxID=2704465 RepID=A0A6C0GME6_9BACT|nr:tyrosine-protein kinase [Rhodocytophaga rosea]QHT69241.1 polysaccharide biosynthesis tyrosine autokinase [Rhodocytophaga rosea]